MRIIFYILTLATLVTSCQPNSSETETKANTPNPLEILTSKISADPSNADLYYQRAQFFYENEAPDGAIQDLANAVKLDSNQANYYHLLADVYLDYFKSYDALRVMESAVARFPNRIPTLLKLSEYQLILKKHDDSFETIDKVLKIDGQNADAWFMLGMNLKEIGETNRAINSFQSAVENDPNMIDAWIILGQMYAEKKDPLALRYFDNALLVEPDNIDVLHAKAFYLNEAEDLSGAVQAYKDIIFKNPNYEDAHFNLGLVFIEMDSLASAKTQFDILLEVSPIHIKGYYYRGLTKEMVGDFAGAQEDFKSALKFSPSYAQAQVALQRVEQEL